MIQGPVTLVNIDAHSDLAMFNGQVNLGNFISKLVDLRIVNEVVWVRGKESMDFEKGSYRFLIGKKKDGFRLASTMPSAFYFIEDDYQSSVKNPRELLLTVEDNPAAGKILTENKRWILSIDYDYFACLNPNIQNLARIASVVGLQALKGMYIKGRSIKSKEEWDAFKDQVNRMAPGLLDATADCMFPNYRLSPEDVEKRLEELLGYIKGSLNTKDCVGVYTVSSLSSGFMDPDMHDLVDKAVQDWLGKLFKD